MVDKITSPIGANELIIKVNSVIDAIPTSTTQLINDSGFITGITSGDVTEALGYTPYDSSNPDGFITSITSSDITDALGYTPYDSSNPDGYITSAAISTLTDVTLNNLDNGEGLIYDSTAGKWKNGTISSGVAWGNITGSITAQADLNTALEGKQATITGAASSITSDNLTGSRVVVSNTSGKVTVSAITTTKLGYLTDVTSNIQAQINGVSSAIPTSTTQLTNDSGFITGITSSMVTTALGYTPYNSSNPDGYITASALSGYEQTTNKVTSITSSSTDTQYPSAKAVYTATNANATAISTINGKIPSQATSTNQLADKAFVNSSISTNTANFIGTFQSVAELEAYSGTKTNNDYAFVETTDTAGNTFYDRYKYVASTSTWTFEYELNNSSFTADQWAAINSGCTTSTASLAASALQSGDNISLLNNNAGYITSITSSDVTTALGYTPYNSTNPNGYISGITSSMVTTALGYTPYNSTNPDGYVTKSVQTVQDIQPITSNTITMSDTISMYSLTPSSTINNLTFSYTGTANKSYTFELMLDMSSVQAVTFNNVTWMDGDTPDLSATGVYFLAFRKIGTSSTWYGNLQGKW